jgi:hypothetical protein
MWKYGAVSYFRRSNPRLITTSEIREPSDHRRTMLWCDGRMLCVNRRRRMTPATPSGLKGLLCRSASGTKPIDNQMKFGRDQRSPSCISDERNADRRADLGPNLSVTGSLATILWLVALRRERMDVSAGRFLRLGLLVAPPALLFGRRDLVSGQVLAASKPTAPSHQEPTTTGKTVLAEEGCHRLFNHGLIPFGPSRMLSPAIITQHLRH